MKINQIYFCLIQDHEVEKNVFFCEFFTLLFGYNYCYETLIVIVSLVTFGISYQISYTNYLSYSVNMIKTLAKL